MRQVLRVLTIITVNVLLVVVLLEVGLRLTAPVLPGQAGVAARWVVADGETTEAAFNPAWQQSSEHYWALRPGLEDALQYGSCNVSFELTTRELWENGGIGFRTDPVDFFVDAVVVGDSFGLCFTDRADCWVDQLAAQSNLGIVNLSQPVTGSTSHYRILRDFGQPLEPPLVIWQFFGNDFFDDYGLALFNDNVQAVDADPPPPLPDESMSDWLRQRSVSFAVLESLATQRCTGGADSDPLFYKPYSVRYGAQDEHLLRFGGAYELQALDMGQAANQIGYELSREAFTEAQELVATWEGELVVVLIPTREEIYAHLTEDQLGAEQIAQLASARQAMLSLCDDLALQCYDAYDAFVERAQAGEALYFTDDMHLNPHGNAVLATALADWLNTR